eukprot:TRINITY_DN43318_c0_g1_i1.p1 TRINITY_DN43318_c0_g1~~TRINITY_DN43318_c0_g1_i1.p1  ORF type:complete len:1350 (-),score=217.80 TRINITY_DN43318_c0_g1_i1:35-4024(-)
MEVYSWGSGNYGRLGLGSGTDVQQPQLVSGVLNGCEIIGAACGWYHSAVVTSTGEVATFGSKVTKCLGTAASESDGSDGPGGSDGSDSESDDDDAESKSVGVKASSRGRQAARTRGRSMTLGGDQRSTAKFVPQILRSFPSRVNVVQVAVGGDMLGAHTLAVSRTGRLYAWGYGPACGLGSMKKHVSTPTLVSKFLGTGAGESGSGRVLKQEMEPLGWGRHSHLRYRMRPSNKELGLQLLKPRIVKAVCGGSFSAVLSSEGEVFTFGISASGRLGFRTKFSAVLRPRRVETLAEGATDLAAGASFVLLCSAAGRLVSWGDNTKGQLGVGHLQESHEPLTLSRACPAAFVMQSVAAGDSHSLALDSSGRTYSWGGEGGPMTGQGQPVPNPRQVDAAFQFRLRQLSHWWVRPHPIRALHNIRIVHIDAGCLHSVALSQDGALFAWGAPLQAASSTASQAVNRRLEVSWIPRLVAPSPKLPLAKIGIASAGGWHSMITAAPCSPLERLLPPPEDCEDLQNQGTYADQIGVDLSGFCDGFLVSEIDSTHGEEVRIPLCCTAARARLAMPDGTDSSIWRAFSAQVSRLRTETLAKFGHESTQVLKRQDEEIVGPAGSSSEEGSLMDLVSMHRQRPKPLGSRHAPMQSSDADEAAGPDLHPTPSTSSKGGHGASSEKLAGAAAPRKKIAPTFSSDSSSGDEKSKPHQKPILQERKQQSVDLLSRPRAVRRAAPILSSDESSDDEELLPDAAVVAARRNHPAAISPKPLPHDAMPGRGALAKRVEALPASLGLDLRGFGEVVLVAFVRFLCTDTLGNLQVIEESHPLWEREQQLRMRPLGPNPAEAGAGEDTTLKRPTQARAARGLLLRREVQDLRRIGAALKLERLVRLCDQLLLRLDAPGAPALFVPASSLGTAMWTLLRQTLRPPERDGPDTDILCAPPGPRRMHWGPRWLPRDGRLQAHAFVLIAGCTALQREQGSFGQFLDDTASASSAPKPLLRLLPADGGGGSAPRYELCLEDYPADVAFAWLRYLYTQDDLSLTWPVKARDSESAALVEQWWMQLLQLAQLMGDKKLQLYAQDMLVGMLSLRNWSKMAAFAEQVQCTVLSESALMAGLRQLLPHMLKSFRVPTGLEPPKRDGQGDKTMQAESWPDEGPGQVATIGSLGLSSGHATGSPLGSVELELEKRLLELRGSAKAAEAQASVLALKRSNAAQFAELKSRLGETITTSQKNGAQLQRCVRYFDSHEQRGFPREGSRGRYFWLEIAVLVALLGIYLSPPVRQSLQGLLYTVLEPIQAILIYMDLEWLIPRPALGYMYLNLIFAVIVLALAYASLGY